MERSPTMFSQGSSASASRALRVPSASWIEASARPFDEESLELTQVGRGDVRHSRKAKAVAAPLRDREAILHERPVLAVLCRPDEQVHRVQPPMIDNGGN